jgi:large conductance mechanosensitive channel
MINKTRGFFEEFKNFAVKGNAFELAIAVLIGTAFSGIINSLVGDIVMPFLALVTNSVDFKDLSWQLRPDLVIKYGMFLQAIFNFLVISIVVFVIFKLVTSARTRLSRNKEE